MSVFLNLKVVQPERTVPNTTCDFHPVCSICSLLTSKRRNSSHIRTIQSRLSNSSHSSCHQVPIPTHLLNIPHQPRSNPSIRIIPLIPIHKAPAPRNPRVCRPRTTQHNIMLIVKEICRIQRIQLHWFEPVMSTQRGRGPFPYASHASLAG